MSSQGFSDWPTLQQTYSISQQQEITELQLQVKQDIQDLVAKYRKKSNGPIPWRVFYNEIEQAQKCEDQPRILAELDQQIREEVVEKQHCTRNFKSKYVLEFGEDEVLDLNEDQQVLSEDLYLCELKQIAEVPVDVVCLAPTIKMGKLRSRQMFHQKMLFRRQDAPHVRNLASQQLGIKRNRPNRDISQPLRREQPSLPFQRNTIDQYPGEKAFNASVWAKKLRNTLLPSK